MVLMMNTAKQNWFNTLNEALEAEGLVDLWPLGSNVNYGETVDHLVELEETFGRWKKPVYRKISVYRDQDGRYERPVHYKTH